jgi:hypothetical protein
MGVEIENSLEAAIGVALPPTSLMRARTIGQIATLMATHMRGNAPAAATSALASPTTAVEPNADETEIDFDALSSEDVDRLLADDKNSLIEAAPNV